MTIYLRIRRYVETLQCNVYLIDINGPAHGLLLHGTMTYEKAMLLAETLGVKTEVEESPFEKSVVQQELLP